MSTRKRVGVVAGAGIGAAAAAALRRSWGRREGDEDPEPAAMTESGRRYLDRLAASVRIPTVSHEDPEDDDPAVFDQFRAFLAETYPLVHARLEVEVVAGRSLLLRWEGADPGAQPVFLLCHQDVVPVEDGTEDGWDHPPFSGVEESGFVWGRGTLDDKGSLIGIFEAVESLIERGFSPFTTLYLGVGHDEEVGGTGAAAIAALLAERGVTLEFLLDEGGAIAEDFLPGVKGPVALVGIGEKGAVDIEIRAVGDGGHSSAPPEHTAVGRVAAAIAAVESAPMAANLEVQNRFFEAIAPVVPRAMGLALGNLRISGRLVEKRLGSVPVTNALIRTTAAATMMSGGVKSNVLPQEAGAIINFRILPGDTIAGVLDHVRGVVGDDVSVRVLEGGLSSEPPPLSDPDSAAF
ncbi:M20/M25/M40 family metallo-hydrolase [bacterium]|nr:M20/M25/M40 family metallo-hydrolase [bacterium]